MKKIFDEIHGYIELTEQERELVDSSLFQRLRRIKQTSLAYLVYPGAMHTRFSHSLGTFHLANRLGLKLYKLGIINDEELEYLRIAALLHDIGQLPLSHCIEPYYIPKGISNVIIRDVIISSTVIRDILSNYGFDYKKVLDIYNGESIISSLIDSDVDVDRMDYLIRDSKHTGVILGNIDLERLLDTIDYQGSKIVVLEKGLHTLENFYISRLHMYQAVYYHKTILGYELFLRKIYRDLIEYCCPEFNNINTIKEMINNQIFSYWDDEWVFSKLYQALSDNEAPEKLRLRIKNFLDRKGPKVVYNEISFNEKKSNLEDVILKLQRYNIPEDSILAFEERIHLIDKSKILVKSKAGVKSISDYASTLINMIPSYLIIRRVYVEHEFSKKAREVISY
ncbi:MAG: HD domain-containing protein [Sulfolobaceae archaeon]